MRTLTLLILSALTTTPALAVERLQMPMGVNPGWLLIARPNDQILAEIYQPGKSAPARNVGESLARSIGVSSLTSGLHVEHSAIVGGLPFGKNFEFYLGKDPSPHGRAGLGLEYHGRF